MIKLNYTQEPYKYGDIGEQNYKENYEVVLNEDITSGEAIIAFIRLLNIATYRISAKDIKNLAEELEIEYGKDRII